MQKQTEIHPFPPFIFDDTRLLIMGTFPPPRARWSMEFYYPNRINDFWYMMGLIFYGNRQALLVEGKKEFDLPKIKALLREKCIGMNDTGYKVHRIKGNASDKFLDIIEPIPLLDLLKRYPSITSLCTTGQKAAEVIADITSVPAPNMGKSVIWHRDCGDITIWRMPSTSRAYPLPLDKKAAYYAEMFRTAGIL